MKKHSYKIQAILGNRFEDVIVKAVSEEEALKEAKKVTTLKSCWTNFVRV